MQTPSSEAHDAALGILAYLKRTRELGITYGPDDTMQLYTDSSFGHSPRPMAGHAVIFGGAAVSWAAKALKIHLRSSRSRPPRLRRQCSRLDARI